MTTLEALRPAKTRQAPSRREFLHLAAGAASAGAAAGQEREPNFLLVMSDQQHWRAAGFQDRFFETPNLDRLAGESTVFENAFCATPQCSPSRSSIFTGWYPSRTGVYGNIGAAGGNDLRRRTIGWSLREAGYVTGYFGKWHLGNDPEANAGWDEKWKKQGDAEVTRRGVDFLKRHAGAGKPFALVLSYLDPHDVYQFRPDRDRAAPGSVSLPRSWREERFDGKPSIQKEFMTADQGRLIWGREQAVWEAYRDFYRRKVANYDAEVGRVLAALDEHGLKASTVVVATSDHGDMDTERRLIFKGPFMYEHMVRVPLLVRMPAALGGRARRIGDFHTVNVDVAPTLAELAGVRGFSCQGRSLGPLLAGGSLKDREFVIGEYYGKQQWVNPIRMIRTPEFKYNHSAGLGEELYNLRNDPDELANRAEDPSFRRAKQDLKAALERWINDNGDPYHSFKRAGKPGG